MKKITFTLMLVIASCLWMTSQADNWCMPKAKALSEQTIRIGGTLVSVGVPCDEEPCPECATIALWSDGLYYLTSDDSLVIAILDTVSIESYAIIEGIHYLEGYRDYINVTGIFFSETDINQLWVEEISVPSPAVQKLLRNGQLLFLREDKTYTSTGQEIK